MWGPRHVYENGSGPKRNQSHSSILWSGRREVQGFASQTLVSLRAIGPCVLRWKMLTHFLSFAPCRVRFPSPGMYMKTALVPKGARAVRLSNGAGDGNRTRVISLEGWGSTIELRPQYGRDDRIRTCGIVLPKHARYQTAPRPDVQSKHYRGFSSSGQRPVRATPRNARGVHESLGRIL